MSAAARRASAARLAADARTFAALGDPTRLVLVNRLAGGEPLPIVSLTEGARISRQAVTKHLAALEAAGLVRSRRRGRERLWELRGARLAEAQRSLEQLSSQWDDALERLRRFVERE
jgi:DNA-binding transcriptional ArsR family regulator